MSERIHLLEASARGLGPISEISVAFGPFNLLFGHNEQGKTYLVEFLLRSLFKSASAWGLREVPQGGRVLVSGLGEEAVPFSPASKQKLEDHWEKVDAGLPLNMARLLVVKGAQLSMAATEPAGINKAVLKEFLSSEAVLDEIQAAISKTVQGARIIDGRIEGHHRGEISQRQGLLEDLERIGRLFDEIGDQYSGGRRAALAREADALEERIELQERAKRHLAFELWGRLAQAEQRAEKIPGPELEALRDAFRDLRHQEESLEQKKAEQYGRTDSRDDYEWAKNALDLYEEHTASTTVSAMPVFIIFALLSAVAAIVAGFLHLPWPMALFVLLAGASAGIYIYQLRQHGGNQETREEVARVRLDYEARFEGKSFNLPALKALVSQLEEEYIRYQGLGAQISEIETKLEALHRQVRRHMEAILGEVPERADWEETISGLRDQRQQSLDEISSLKVQLGTLDVPPEAQIPESPGVEYEPGTHRDLQERLRSVQADLEAELKGLDTLKQRVCQETGEDISLGWSPLIQALQARRAEVVKEYRQLTAQILGEIHVNNVIEELRKQEDSKIRARLNSAEVLDPLFQTTGRYRELELQDGSLFVSDGYARFPLSQLSTGTLEQVLLALRVGFASALMGDRRAFLILDDAFQHADWDRRERLLGQVIDLAQSGWQILYFTMDDHLRDLFVEAGEAHFGEGFHFVELDAEER